MANNNQPMFDETEVRKAISVIVGNGNLFECRIVGSKNKLQPSGYFKDVDKFIECLLAQNLRDANAYIVLNRIKDECYGREQGDKFIAGVATTSDNDIEGRTWILVDFDPKRASHTSSTDEQVEAAKSKAEMVYKYLKQQGFYDPVVAFSGNGYHLLYRVRLENSDENKKLVERFLKTLDALFSDDVIEVDTATYNAGRICKLYGTIAHKGRSTKEQPHRMSRITYVPREVLPVAKKYIEKVANSITPDTVQSNKYNGYNSNDFDIETWMDKYGLAHRAIPYSGGTKYILEHCPFDSSHKGKDAAIFKMSNGAIAFKCLHNSCSDKRWQDVRTLFEPDAYSRKWEEQKKTMYKPNREQAVSRPIVEVNEQPIFLTAKQILERPKPEESFIKTGITEIDKKMRGLKKEHTSVWSGLRASAKSTILSQIILNAVNSGNVAIAYSGELSGESFMRWMNQQAAGHHTEPSLYEGYYNTPIEIQKKIADWLEGKFYLYNNFYGNDFEAVISKIEDRIKEHGADLLILDNLMAFNISSLGYTKWDAQSAFVWKLHEMAIKQHIHIAFVAHPKKAAGFLRFDDISGTADLGNAVDDAFIVHRNNEDFRRLTKEMFKWNDNNPIYEGTNVIEIVKDRDGGNQDVFIPLYYEVRSKRLKNSVSENVVYGWEGDFSDGFLPLPEDIAF